MKEKTSKWKKTVIKETERKEAYVDEGMDENA